jgi:hypothetical protein
MGPPESGRSREKGNQVGKVVRVAVLTGLLALTACGSARHTGGTSPAASTPATSATSGSAGTTATSTANNGEAAKSADEIVADAQQATGAASSVHVSGSGTSSGTVFSIDAVLGQGRGGAGRSASMAKPLTLY